MSSILKSTSNIVESMAAAEVRRRQKKRRIERKREGKEGAISERPRAANRRRRRKTNHQPADLFFLQWEPQPFLSAFPLPLSPRAFPSLTLFSYRSLGSQFQLLKKKKKKTGGEAPLGRPSDAGPLSL